MRPFLIAAALIALTACVMPGSKKPAATAVNPISGTAVTVETLDTPAAQPQAKAINPEKPAKPEKPKKPKKTKALPSPVAGQVDASADAISLAEAAKPAPPPPDAAAEAKPQAAKETPEEPAAEPPPEPAPPDSPEAAKCLKQGNVWATAGKSGAKACVKRTKDAGKSCTRQTQCEGFCLARSGTCAPVTPLFGCTDILQADGREVTLCLD